MEAKDLVVGGKYMYQEDPHEEKVQATVLAIDNEKQIVRFVDWDDFEWDERFEDIEDTVKRKL